MHQYAGSSVAGRRTTGVQLDLRFPELVAVEQPIDGFTDLAALTYDAPGGLRLELTFEGEAFETEDQRNWIDASFKTYSTPLSLPRPVILRQGTRIEQRVTLRLHKAQGTAIASSAHVRPVTVQGPLEREEVNVPAIGVGLGALDVDAPSRTLALLKELNPAHLRVDLPLASGGWEDRLDRALKVQRVLGCGLELALLVGPECGAALDSLATLLPPRVGVARILAFAADRPTTSMEALGARPGAAVVGDATPQRCRRGQPRRSVRVSPVPTTRGGNHLLVDEPAGTRVGYHEPLRDAAGSG